MFTNATLNWFNFGVQNRFPSDCQKLALQAIYIVSLGDSTKCVSWKRKSAVCGTDHCWGDMYICDGCSVSLVLVFGRWFRWRGGPCGHLCLCRRRFCFRRCCRRSLSLSFSLSWLVIEISSQFIRLCILPEVEICRDHLGVPYTDCH